MKSYLKPWWLSVAANISLLLFLLIHMDGQLNEYFTLVLSFSGGTVVSAIMIYWLHLQLRRNQNYRYAAIVALSISQAFVLMLSLSILSEFKHMPSASEVKFMFDYPKYSLVMAWERIGFIEILSAMVFFWGIVYCWSNSAAGEQAVLRYKKRGFLLGLGLLVAASTSSSARTSQVVELHYIQLGYEFLLGSVSAQKSSGSFELGRLEIPELPLSNLSGIKKPNILFFRLEEVSRDKYGLYVESEHPTSPYANALKQRSLGSFFVFENHIANAGATDTSTTLIYTGLQASRSGKEFGYYPMLWDYANAVGYETFMAIPFHIGWGQLDKKWSANDGDLSLDLLIDAARSGREIRYDNSITDDAVADIVISWQENRDHSRPFLGVVNLKLPHAHGEGVDTLGYENLGCPTEPRRFSNYECSIFVLDREMGRIIDHLESVGELDNTIIIAAPDHGSDQNKHNKGRIYNYFQEVLSVPLFMRIPEKFQPPLDKINPDWRDNIKKVTQNVDILPTVVDLLGISQSPPIADIIKGLDGVSLFSDFPDDRWVFSMNSNDLRPWKPTGFGINVGRDFKYIYFEGQEQLFDLQVDAGESNNLLLQPSMRDVALHEKIKAYISNNPSAKKMYRYRFPEEITYDQTFEYAVAGKDLPSAIGVIKEGSTSLYSTGVEGLLSYGPYVALEEGHYLFELTYSLRPSKAEQSASTYSLGYLENDQWLTLSRGDLAVGENRALSIPVSVSPEHKNKPIELGTKFKGGGELEIIKLEIKKIKAS